MMEASVFFFNQKHQVLPRLILGCWLFWLGPIEAGCRPIWSPSKATFRRMTHVYNQEISSSFCLKEERIV